MIEVRQEILQLLDATTYHTDAHWRSDDNLHTMFIDHCGNEVMARILKSLRATTRLFEIDRLKDRLKPDSTEHLVILDALQAEDDAAVRRAVATHIQTPRGFCAGDAAVGGWTAEQGRSSNEYDLIVLNGTLVRLGG